VALRRLAAERSVWVVGVLASWVVVRREVVWPVSVVVAVDMGTWDLLVGGEWGGPAAKTCGGTIGKRALADGGFGGQGRAIGHWSDHGAVRRRDGQQGWRKLVGRGARRSAQPCSPHNLLADTTRLAGCGGRLVGVLALAPISQPILSESQAALGTRPCGPERLKTS